MKPCDSSKTLTSIIEILWKGQQFINRVNSEGEPIFDIRQITPKIEEGNPQVILGGGKPFTVTQEEHGWTVPLFYDGQNIKSSISKLTNQAKKADFMSKMKIAVYLKNLTESDKNSFDFLFSEKKPDFLDQNFYKAVDPTEINKLRWFLNSGSEKVISNQIKTIFRTVQSQRPQFLQNKKIELCLYNTDSVGNCVYLVIQNPQIEFKIIPNDGSPEEILYQPIIENKISKNAIVIKIADYSVFIETFLCCQEYDINAYLDIESIVVPEFIKYASSKKTLLLNDDIVERIDWDRYQLKLLSNDGDSYDTTGDLVSDICMSLISSAINNFTNNLAKKLEPMNKKPDEVCVCINKVIGDDAEVYDSQFLVADALNITVEELTKHQLIETGDIINSPHK